MILKASRGLEFMLHGSVALEKSLVIRRGGHRRREVVELVLHGAKRRENVQTRLMDARMREGRRVLREIAERQAASVMNVPERSIRGARPDAKERGLALAVGADEAYAVAGGDLNRDGAQDFKFSVPVGDVVGWL